MFSKSRGLLYCVARLLGDVNAISRGTYPLRVVRKFLLKNSGKMVGKLTKK